MPPAARITDMHTCPMVTGIVPHVGGPILPPGVPQVLIGMLPAATVTNMLTCVGPPDMIAKGSAGVFINYLPAARMGDLTAHGGVIILGEPTVIIGEIGSPSPGAGGLGGIVAGLTAAAVNTPSKGDSTSANASVYGTPGQKGSNPPYEPARWNKDPVQTSTNCYAYAANNPGGHPANTKPQPGQQCGHPAPDASCQSVTAAATCDGMVPAPNPPPAKPGYYAVALVSAPAANPAAPPLDYHWYRQDDNGNWSHKPGWSEATNKDASGNPITNPQTADRNYGRLNYSNFCGYFYVPAGGLQTGPP